MGASCTISSVCGLAQEARQYTNDENLILSLVNLANSNEFAQAVSEMQRKGSTVDNAIVTYHKDGTPTYQSIVNVLNTENNLAKTDLNVISRNTLDQINPTGFFDVETMLKNKLYPIAQSYASNFRKSEEDQSVGDLNYKAAVDIFTAFNLQNAAQGEYIAVLEKENKFSATSKYKVKIKKYTPELKKSMLENAPKLAAIQAAINV